MVGYSADVDLAEDGPTERSLDTLFEVLSDERRRHVLASLDREAVSLAALAEDVAELERSSAGDGATAPASIRSSLHHIHLPKLADADLVAYDRDRRTVEPGGSAELDDLLSSATASD